MTGGHDGAVAAARPGGLLEQLMAAVRPQFRGEVFRPARDDMVFVRGECRVVRCANMVGRSARGICNSHYQRWLQTRGQGGDSAWPKSQERETSPRFVTATKVTVPPAMSCSRSA